LINGMQFKEILAQRFGVPASQQRIIYAGRILKDVDTLKSQSLPVA
jgi:hypothetical protein